MPEPVIEVYFNVGTDESPVWKKMTSSLSLYWVGKGTDASNIVPITRKLSNQWASELWIGDYPTYGNGTQTVYVPPNSTVQVAKLFKIVLVSGTLTDKVELTAYDNTLHQSATMQIFGTEATNYTSWLKGKPTGGSFETEVVNTPPVNWCSYTLGTDVADDIANQLKGDEGYIRWSSIPTEGQCLYGVLAHVVPNDALAGWHSPVLTVRYKWIE